MTLQHMGRNRMVPGFGRLRPTTITRHALGNLDHRFELQKHRVLIVPIGEQHFFDAHEVDAAHTEFSAGFVEATRG